MKPNKKGVTFRGRGPLHHSKICEKSMSDPNQIIRQNCEVQLELEFQGGNLGWTATTLTCKHCRSNVRPPIEKGKCKLCENPPDFAEADDQNYAGGVE